MKKIITLLCITIVFSLKAQELTQTFNSTTNVSFRLQKIIELENGEFYLFGTYHTYSNGGVWFDNNFALSTSVIKIDKDLNVLEEHNFPKPLKNIQVINNIFYGTFQFDTILFPCNMSNNGNTNKYSTKNKLYAYDLNTDTLISKEFMFQHNQCGDEGVFASSVLNNNLACYYMVENIISPTNTIQETLLRSYNQDLNENNIIQNNFFTEYGLTIDFLDKEKTFLSFKDNSISIHDSVLNLKGQFYKNNIDSFYMQMRQFDSNNNYYVLSGTKRLYSSIDLNHHNPTFVSEILLLDKQGNIINDKMFYNLQIDDIALTDNNEILALHNKRFFIDEEKDKPYTVLKLNLDLEIEGKKEYGLNAYQAKIKALKNNKFSLFGTLETESLINHTINKGYVVIDYVNRLNEKWSGLERKKNKIVISLYPNPVKNILKIDYSVVGKLFCKVYNLQGLEVFKSQVQNKFINLKEIKTGFFYIKIYNENNEVLTIEKLFKD